MEKNFKKILLLITHSGERYTFSVPEDKDHMDVYKYALKVEDLEEKDIKKLLYFPNTIYDLEEVQYYYDDEKEEFDDKEMSIDFKIDEFRKQRALLFKALDMEFMRSLENIECESCRQGIVDIKNHMRDLPDFLTEYLKQFDAKDIISFNCFDNVYDITMINGGSGYTEAPKVNISAPDSEHKGVQMEAETEINAEGKVTGIKVTQIGSGYKTAPKVNIEKPTNGNVATAFASFPENDIFNVKQ